MNIVHFSILFSINRTKDKKKKKNSSLGAIYATGLFKHSRLRIEFANSDSTLPLILHTALKCP